MLRLCDTGDEWRVLWNLQEVRDLDERNHHAGGHSFPYNQFLPAGSLALDEELLCLWTTTFLFAQILNQEEREDPTLSHV